MDNDFEYTPPSNIVSPDEPVSNILINIADYLLLTIGSVAVVLFVFGAFVWIFAKGDEEQINKAKKLFFYAIFGALFALLSYVIVEYVIDIFI